MEDYEQNYDRLMNKLFGDKFYNEEEKSDQEIKKYLSNVEKEMEFNEEIKEEIDGDNEEIKMEKEQGLIPKPNLPTFMKHKITSEEVHNI